MFHLLQRPGQTVLLAEAVRARDVVDDLNDTERGVRAVAVCCNTATRILRGVTFALLIYGIC